MARAALACVVLALVALSAPASARQLLHKHHKHRKGQNYHGHHHGHHHGECKTISQVLHEEPSLKRFAAAFDKAHVPFVEALVKDAHARATFLAVPDGNLGTGDTVFDKAPIRFQQHTVLDRIKTCKVHNGDNFTTLAGTRLTIVKERAAHGGRHLLQSTLSTAWTSLLDALPAAEEVPASTRPVSNAAFALPASLPAPLPAAQGVPEGQPEGRPMARDEEAWEHHGKHVHGQGGHENGKHEDHHKKHAHGKSDHEEHHGWHGKHHKKHHQQHSVQEMVAHAFEKSAKKVAKHAATYLQVDDTSQRIKILASVRACEGTVLIVSAFLNAPPTPDPVVMLQAQQSYQSKAHKLHHGKHHVKHHGHSHGHVHHVMHTVKDTLKRFALMLGLRHKGCGKHAKGQLKHHPEAHEEVDPELLAFAAARERAASATIVGKTVPQQAALQVAFSKVPLQRGVAQVQQRLADPRALNVPHAAFPLNLAVEAAEALEGSADKFLQSLHLDGAI